MTTLDQEAEIIRMVYYGDPGTGKTTAAATMARLGKVIYIDAEQGLKGRALAHRDIPLNNIEPHREISYEALRQLAWDIKARTDDGEPIAGIVWDSMTATVPALLSNITAAQAAKAQRKGEERASYVAHQDDWGNVVAQVRELFRFMRDLPVHLVIVAHPKRSTDEEGAVRVGPASTPALSSEIMAFTDLVVMCRTTEVGGQLVHSALTKPVGKYDAKDRYGCLPTNMAEPQFDRILSYVDGNIDEASDPVQEAARKISNNNKTTGGGK